MSYPSAWHCTIRIPRKSSFSAQSASPTMPPTSLLPFRHPLSRRSSEGAAVSSTQSESSRRSSLRLTIKSSAKASGKHRHRRRRCIYFKALQNLSTNATTICCCLRPSAATSPPRLRCVLIGCHIHTFLLMTPVSTALGGRVVFRGRRRRLTSLLGPRKSPTDHQ